MSKNFTVFVSYFGGPFLLFSFLSVLILCVGVVTGEQRIGGFFNIPIHHEKAMFCFLFGIFISAMWAGVKLEDLTRE